MGKILWLTAAVCLCVAAVLTLYNCNSDPGTDKSITSAEKGGRPEFDLGSATVRVLDYAGTSDDSETRFLLAVEADRDIPDTLTFSMRCRVEAEGWFGGRLALQGKDGRLCGLEAAIDRSHPHRMRIHEFTNTDTLTWIYEVSDNVVTETYTVNGRSIELCYPNIPLDRKEQLAALYGENPATLNYRSGFTIDELVLLRQMQKFESFNDEENSLNHNEYGFLLADLATDESFTEWLRNDTDHDDSDDEPLRISAEKMCALAGVTSGIKCLLGGWSNFICVAAAGVSIACGIAGLAA